MRANSPVEFMQDYLFPSPRARDTVSFRIDDVLLTAASDSEDFGPSLADALPLSGQEARPSPAYSELVDDRPTQLLNRPTQLPCWSSAGVFAREDDSRGGCYHP